MRQGGRELVHFNFWDTQTPQPGTLTLWRPKQRLGLQTVEVQKFRRLGLQKVNVLEAWLL